LRLALDVNQTFSVNGVSFDMIAVEGGTFTMGATEEQGSDAKNNEKPTHQVTLSSYSIGKTEVTQALWQAVMGKSVSQIASENGWNTYGVGSNYPMYYISYEDCQTFIRKLNALTGKNFRLPTEAEWEFAARGGNNSCVYKYSGSNTLSNVAWYDDNSSNKTHPVATKASNELGIYDMTGNVWEWCSDWYGSYSSSSQYNPTGSNTGSNRVGRGGSWHYFAWNCRVSDRFSSAPTFRSHYLGLRLAL
ncbi:MAG: formylglycine-generating enzyme family protein, partial [bacterium]|nr:formylglycine-generating enzyme family protein [bacterium]